MSVTVASGEYALLTVKNGVRVFDCTVSIFKSDEEEEFHISSLLQPWFLRRANLLRLEHAIQHTKNNGRHSLFMKIGMVFGDQFHFGYFPKDHQFDNITHVCCSEMVVELTKVLAAKLALSYDGITFTVTKGSDIKHLKCAVGIKVSWD